MYISREWHRQLRKKETCPGLNSATKCTKKLFLVSKLNLFLMVKGEAIRVINYDDFFFHVSRKMERKLTTIPRS